MKPSRKGLPNRSTSTRWNVRLILKVVLVVIWLSFGFAVDYSFPIMRFNGEVVENVAGFIENNTTWWDLSFKGRVFYFYYCLLAPLAHVLPIYFFWWRVHRKTLIVNGKPEGKVIFIWRGTSGLIYDLACLFLRRGRHLTDDDWGRLNRPISGRFLEENLTVYYRPHLVTHPLRFIRVIAEKTSVGIWWVSVSGRYNNRIRDLDNPFLNWVVMTEDGGYSVEPMNEEKWEQLQKDTIFQVKERTYLMGQAEPSLVHRVVGASSYYIDDGFKMDSLEELRRHPEIFEKWLKGEEVTDDD